MGIKTQAVRSLASVAKAPGQKASRLLATELSEVVAQSLPALDKAGFAQLDRDVVKEIAAFNAKILDKSPDLLRIKYQRMAENPFSFFRGTDHLLRQPEALNVGARTALQGDLHVNQFGTMLKRNGKLEVAINDCDEALVGPVMIDLKHFGTSIVLAGQEAGLTPSETRKLVAHFGESYSDTLKELTQHALELGDIPKPKIIKDLLKKAEHSELEKWLEHMAPLQEGKRSFLRDETTRSVSSTTLADLQQALSLFREGAAPEVKAELTSYSLRDAVAAMGGLGSVGRSRYRLLLESSEGRSPLILEMKEEVPAAMAPYVAGANPFQREAERSLTISRLMGGELDPMMGQTTLPRRDALQSDSFLVKRLTHTKAGIDATTLKDYDEFKDLVKYYSSEIAIGHASGVSIGLADAQDLLASLGKKKDFKADLVNASHREAQQVQREFRAFTAALAQEPLLKTAR